MCRAKKCQHFCAVEAGVAKCKCHPGYMLKGPKKDKCIIRELLRRVVRARNEISNAFKR